MTQAVMKRKAAERGVSAQQRATRECDQTIWPLDAPGMPPIGSAVTGWATDTLGEQAADSVKLRTFLEQVVRKCLYVPGSPFPLVVEGRRKIVECLPGHIWGADKLGPSPAKVFVVGKLLGDEEVVRRRHFVGPSGQLLLQTCRELSVRCADWYVTTLMKCPHPRRGKADIPGPWVAEWLPLLHQELRLVRPEIILCLGADALKALLGKNITLTSLQGAPIPFRYRIDRENCPDGEEEWATATLFALPHPASALRNPQDQVRLHTGMLRFRDAILPGLAAAPDVVDHRVIDNIEDLVKLEKEIEAECFDNIIAIDAEWQGEHPQNAGSYLRTIQISWKDKTAASLRLRAPGGAPGFQGGIKEALAGLNRICKNKIIVGSYLTSDLAWFQAVGLTDVVSAFFNIPTNWREYQQKFHKREGPLGFDIAYALHSVDETASFDLNDMLLRFTSAPRYDLPLEDWKNEYCRSLKISRADLPGYGDCPDNILIGEPIEKPADWGDRAGYPVKNSYGAYDADVTRRICLRVAELLDKDSFGNNCWESFWSKMQAAPAVLEMNTTGIPVDKERLQALTGIYQAAVDSLEAKLRKFARWPDFNLRSVYHVREFLFGSALNGKKKASPTSPPIRIRPAGAVSLRLTPTLTTDKRAMWWRDVVAKGLVHEKTPSTGKLALAILAEEAMNAKVPVKGGRIREVDFSRPVIWLRQHRFISQTLKYVLRPPKTDEAGEVMETADGDLVYDRGVPAAICDDGRLRGTHLPTKETGRWSVVRPSMQNFTKRREKDYKNILGEHYRWPLRSILCAPPGYCLVESDYKGAELYVMAVLSGDENMLSHVIRNQLPEDDPNYYDIHSAVTVLAFHLDCPATKQGLASVGKKHLRDVAKAVVFGVAYGRGARAVAVGLREEGVSVSEEEAQRLIDALFELYPRLEPFYAQCRERVCIRGRDEDGREYVEPGPLFIGGVYRDYRRFRFTEDTRDLGDMEREAQNFPIQNAVAALVNRSVGHLYRYRQEHPDVDYRLALQVHDAVISLVPNKHVTRYCNEVIPECMGRRVPLYRCDLSGQVISDKPFHLGVETTVFSRWNEAMLPDECLNRGFRPELAGWRRQGKGFVHDEYPKKLWKIQQLAKLNNGKSLVIGGFHDV